MHACVCVCVGGCVWACVHMYMCMRTLEGGGSPKKVISGLTIEPHTVQRGTVSAKMAPTKTNTTTT